MILRGDKCKNAKEIDDFIERIGVGTWSNYYESDLTSHEMSQSATRKETFMTQSLLDPKRLTTNLIDIRRNTI